MRIPSFAFSFALAVIFLQPAHADQRVVCQTSGSTQTCNITEPTVTQRQTSYPAIRFHPGSFVTIHAGGCVQSGGSGQTWHRYVDPTGPDTDHLYHGLISYPGSGGLVRFSPAAQTSGGWTIQIPQNAQVSQNAPDNVPLVLGFEDDNYGDNGYWGHDRDNGPNGQCPTPGTPDADRGKAAWVTITIATSGVAAPNKAMDLISDTVDPNGLPLNPWWAYEKRTNPVPGGPPDPLRLCGCLRYIDSDNVDQGINLTGADCTTQSPSVNQGQSLNGELCRWKADAGVLAGHLNWFVSTYQGKIRWQEWSGTVKADFWDSGDDDYNFILLPDTKTGLTAARPEWIGLEFDSDEVVDRIDKGWWDNFHHLVDIYGGPDGAAGQSIYDSPATVIGLMGLDSEHGAYSELHPVYGMAIRTNSDAGHVGTDDWVFIARNFGNEGYCSDGNMTVPELTTLSFFIPRDNAVGDDPNSPTSFDELYSTKETNGVSLSFVPGGAVISFDLGPPKDQTVYSGHVQFHWKLDPATTSRGGVLKRAVVSQAPIRLELNPDEVMANGVPVKIDVDAEDLKKQVFGSFPAGFTSQLKAALEPKSSTPQAFPVHRVAHQDGSLQREVLRPELGFGHPTRKVMPRYIRAVPLPDPEKAEQEAQLLKLYCSAFPNGKSPNITTRSCGPLHARPGPIINPGPIVAPGPIVRDHR